MKKITLFLSPVILSFSNVYMQTSDDISKAKEFIDLLNKSEFTKAESYFSDEMKAKLSAEKLEEVWKLLPNQVEKFKGLGDKSTRRSQTNGGKN